MKKAKKTKKNIKRYILGTLLGVAVGFLVNQVSTGMSSPCMLLCEPEITMSYFGLAGFVLSLK